MSVLRTVSAAAAAGLCALGLAAAAAATGPSDGVSFAWRDAGAGALAAFGLVALFGVAAYGLRSRAARPPASGAAS